MTFSSTVSAPPGGKWFWEDGKVLFESASYHEVVDRMRRYFLDNGIDKSAEAALAEYMCPRMPSGFCRGFDGSRRKTAREILADTERVCAGKQLETIDVVERRLEKCAKCPKCDHSICVTCRRIDDLIYKMFDGRRCRLILDKVSGVCTCAGAYSMAVASLCFDKNSPAWEGVPATCWRNEE